MHLGSLGTVLMGHDRCMGDVLLIHRRDDLVEFLPHGHWVVVARIELVIDVHDLILAQISASRKLLKTGNLIAFSTKLEVYIGIESRIGIGVKVLVLEECKSDV